MKRRFTLVFLIAAALTIVWPAASTATAPNNESNSYMFFMEVPNSAQNSAGDTLAVTGEGTFDILVGDDLQPTQEVTIRKTSPQGAVTEFKAVCRIDTPVEVEYYRNGGILHTVLRNLLKAGK